MDITYIDQSYEIDVKRFYAPIILSGECPHCGTFTTMDFTRDYMNYPDLNKPFKVNMYHKQETHCQGFTVMVQLSLNLEVISKD